MPNEEVLVEILECEQNTQIAHLILNSPETLNSLTLKMVNLISDLLDAWEQDSQIKMIFIYRKIKQRNLQYVYEFNVGI